MDPKGSVLAEIALRLTRSPEDAATEGLAYVLSHSEAAVHRVERLLEDWTSSKPREIVTVRSQVRSDDESRPDLVANDKHGAPVVIFENKFWAALTPNQPVSYLKRLAAAGGVVCCVAPEARLGFLWTELLDRVGRDMPETLHVLRDESKLKLAKVGEDRALVLTTWFFLLDQIRTALEESGDETGRAGDVRQIIGLAERMDTAGFPPLTDADFSGPSARHFLQFSEIVDKTVSKLQNGPLSKDFVSKKGLKASSGKGWYGHGVWIYGHGCNLLFTAWRWRNHPRNPIWLRVASANWQYPENVEHAVVAELGRDNCFEDRTRGWAGIWIPIKLQVGRELDQVVEDTYAQVRRVAEALRPFATQPATEISPEEPEPS